ncbi:uncharacterized protein LOC108735025 isoform X2 [Agrilus planipennis]|uniref:Uncharacterized protein LOC108735025 isoform X2 n=1 Tax=Agrilus planipennis TaxID=224129 RepID=A0A1W4WQK6_AGRPL|nr:uncharacterized protein LOC108735025 isoform X2 [Agrilus planipennis]
MNLRMYKLQKKLLQLENDFDNLNAENERKHLLENLRELRQIKQISSSEKVNLISKLAESNITADQGMPYIALNKQCACKLQNLKSLIFAEFNKTDSCKKQEYIDMLLDKHQNEYLMDFLRDLEESKFFLNNFASNLSLFLEVAKDNLNVDDVNNPNNTILSSCSSITVDFENCKNNPNIAASSPVNSDST